ncbi:MAG: hypothetical protein E7663_06290 [Ruminococcaceae bacterium]|nr:hypothetical protein [Oscillospiraceae bacterium]
MYEYRPRKTNHRAATAVALLLAASVTAFIGAALFSFYPSILQCVGLCLLIPVIQLTSRYLVLQYLYRVRSYDEGGADLEIFSYRGGSRMQLVCRVALSDITAIHPLGEQNRKPPHRVHRYDYCPDLSPLNAVVLSVANGDGEQEIQLSPDERMLTLLQGGMRKGDA